MDALRLIKDNFKPIYDALDNIEACCTTAALCEEAMQKALTLVPLEHAIPLVQMALTNYCTLNNHCDETLDNVAYYHHELAISYIESCDALSDAKRVNARELCRLVHMDCVTCEHLLEVV